MRRRIPYIPQRRAVFVGCEGASEVSYAGFLQNLLLAEGHSVHLVVHDLGSGAGDPLARIGMAVRRLEHLRRTRLAPAERFVLLDFDQAERDPLRARDAQRLAEANSIVIVWQRPCFEAILLRHLDGCTTYRPQGTPAAQRALTKEWPGYRKPMTRVELARRIDREAILRAAGVEPELAMLLECIGLSSR